MEIMEFLKIADVLSAVFQLDHYFFQLAMVKIQMIFSELLTICIKNGLVCNIFYNLFSMKAC